MPIFEGSTVDQAIQQGLSELHLTKETALVTILEEGKKGFLGLGKKVARVKVEAIEAPVEDAKPIDVSDVSESKTKPAVEQATQSELTDAQVLEKLALYLTDISQALQAPAVVEFTRENNQTMLHLQTDKQGLLIGKHGKTLNALQYLAQVYVHRLTKSKLSIVLNVGEYREKREAILHRLADRTADKVVKTGRPIFLEPMPAFERKQIHAALSKNQAIQTHSEGEEPYRYLVVESVDK